MVNQSAGKRAIVVHAGIEMGFIEGAELINDSRSASADYHDEMNRENCNEWLQRQLIPKPPPRCIVALDNAPYHTAQKNKAPTSASRRVDYVGITLQ
ncbi:hypothetical protein PR048_011873 [Dryococelus australis]|uniref:Tc1-like transposase DDE domain-containing protein n=1 Tax=Dryococelus australis TaxID=614101 RepID=A0ABQ9HMR4_9NEOP|nr:hypothetical protein PR048_011873 [Dryococelus australis]